MCRVIDIRQMYRGCSFLLVGVMVGQSIWFHTHLARQRSWDVASSGAFLSSPSQRGSSHDNMMATDRLFPAGSDQHNQTRAATVSAAASQPHDARRTSETIDSVLRQRIRETTEKTPGPKCGVHYYYHIGKNGGQSIRDWQRMIRKNNRKTVKMYYLDQQLHTTELDYEGQRWRERFQLIVQAVQSGELYNTAKKKWITIHHHDRTPGLKFMMPRLREWREILRPHGCAVALTTNLREPLSRAKSQIAYNNVCKEDLPNFSKGYMGQARYLMYNTCQPRNDTKYPEWCTGAYITKHHLADDELQELYGYLLEFDVIGKTVDHNEFIGTMESLMRWKSLKHPKELQDGQAPRTNKSVPKYNLTKEMVEMLIPALETDYKLWHQTFGDIE